MPYFLPDLRIRDSLGQFQEAVSKYMAHTSQYVAQKIRSSVDGMVSGNGRNTLPKRAMTPLRFPQLNEVYLLMDVDYLRPQGMRPWAHLHGLQVMNPDPDYLNEEDMQGERSPMEDFDDSRPGSFASDPRALDDAEGEQEFSTILSQLHEGSAPRNLAEYSGPPFLEDVEIDTDGKNFASACLSSIDLRSWEHQDSSPVPGPAQSSLSLPCLPECTGKLLLYEDIQNRPEDAALLAGMIRAGLATQRSRNRRQ